MMYKQTDSMNKESIISSIESGKSGTNGQVDTIRLMNPKSAKNNGAIPAYPKGHVEYENASGQAMEQ